MLGNASGFTYCFSKKAFTLGIRFIFAAEKSQKVNRILKK
jgi:hypothetical protein